MSSYSDFQLRHPLSKKKYLKKMLGVSIALFLLSCSVSGAIVILRYIADLNVNFSILIIPLGVFVVIGFFYSWYIKSYIKLYYYNCDENFITIKKGVFMPVEIHVLYQKIQDVYVDQDILDRILGIYDVHIASATVSSATEAHIDGLDKETAEATRDFLLAKVHGHSVASSAINTGSSKPNKTVAAIKYNASEVVSSKNYPIANRWLLVPFLTSFFYSALLIFVLVSENVESDENYNLLIVYGALVAGIGKFIWSCIWKKNYHFELTEESILLKTGVVSRSSRHLPYKSIKDISVSQGVIDRLLGLYTVSIQDATSSSGLVIVGQSKEHADKLSSVLNGIIGKKSDPSSMGL